MKKKVDLTDLILNDINQKKNPTLRLFLIIGFVLLIIGIFFLVKNINFSSESINPIKPSSQIVKKDGNVKTNQKIKTALPKEIDFSQPIYYIQVSVFNKNKNPDKYFLKKIKKNNFKIKIISSEKFKKILIGPYYGYSAAKENLPSIQENIEKGAFITKI